MRRPPLNSVVTLTSGHEVTLLSLDGEGFMRVRTTPKDRTKQVTFETRADRLPQIV